MSVAIALVLVLEGIAGLAIFFGIALIAETLISIDNQVRSGLTGPLGK